MSAAVSKFAISFVEGRVSADTFAEAYMELWRIEAFVSEGCMSFERLGRIETKEDFADFVGELREGLMANPSDWKNPDLVSFLDAMEAWVRSIDRYAKNSGDSDVASPSWSTFAKILCASKYYE